MRAGVRDTPRALLTLFVTIGMLGNLQNAAYGADSAGRDLVPRRPAPHAGIAAAFAGIRGFGQLLPGSSMRCCLITEAAVETVFGLCANIAGNWFFIAAMTVIFVPVIWFVMTA